MEKDFLVIDWWHCLVSFAGDIGDIVFLAVIWYVKQTNLKNYVFLYELLQPSQASENFCFCCCYWVASVVSDSVRPHRRQPTRLHCRWGSPGKNTGVGCYFLLQCMKVKSESEVAQSCPTPSDPMDCSLPGSSILGIFQARVLVWVAIAFSRKLLLLPHNMTVKTNFYCLFCLVFADFWCNYKYLLKQEEKDKLYIGPIFM